MAANGPSRKSSSDDSHHETRHHQLCRNGRRGGGPSILRHPAFGARGYWIRSVSSITIAAMLTAVVARNVRPIIGDGDPSADC